MATGQVKFYSLGKGYGFIEPDEGGVDIFIHRLDLEVSDLQFLSDKQKVSYETKEHKGKIKAVNVKVLS